MLGEAAVVTVDLHALLRAFPLDPLSLAGDAAEVAALGGYAWGVRRLRRRGRAVPRAAMASFAAGVVALFVALGSGVAAYDDTNFPCHVVQHLLIMMVAPPLLALGRPVTLLAQAGGRRLQRAVVRAANSRLVARASGSAIVPVYYGAMWVVFLTPLYRADVTNTAVHAATHVVLFVVGYLFWGNVVGREVAPAHASPIRRIAFILLGGPPEGALGVLLLIRPHPLWGQSLVSTHDGGGLFVLGAMLVAGAALTLVFSDWARRDEERTRRGEERTRRVEQAAPAVGLDATLGR